MPREPCKNGLDQCAPKLSPIESELVSGGGRVGQVALIQEIKWKSDTNRRSVVPLRRNCGKLDRLAI